jgi:hypothetical protein
MTQLGQHGFDGRAEFSFACGLHECVGVSIRVSIVSNGADPFRGCAASDIKISACSHAFFRTPVRLLVSTVMSGVDTRGRLRQDGGHGDERPVDVRAETLAPHTETDRLYLWRVQVGATRNACPSHGPQTSARLGVSRFSIGPLVLTRRVPDGTAGVRDVDAPCTAFAPGEPSGTGCITDGHYLCRECVHAPERDPYDESPDIVYDPDRGWVEQ